jgi:hypothetical protein
MFKKIGQKVLNRKVCLYLPSRQIFKFGIIKKKKDNEQDLKIRSVLNPKSIAYSCPTFLRLDVGNKLKKNEILITICIEKNETSKVLSNFGGKNSRRNTRCLSNRLG